MVGGELVPWTELTAWARGTDTDLTRWEMDTIRLMSSAYLSRRLSKEKNAPTPLLTEESYAIRAKIYSEERKATMLAKAKAKS